MHAAGQLAVHDAIPARILAAIRIRLRLVDEMPDPDADVRIHARQAVVADEFRLRNGDAEASDDVGRHVRRDGGRQRRCRRQLLVLLLVLQLVQSVGGLTVGGLLQVARRRDAQEAGGQRSDEGLGVISDLFFSSISFKATQRRETVKR